MRSVSRRLADLCENTKINLGRVGDNLHTQVRIDCLKLFEEYPSATAALTVRPPKGDSYPAVIVRDGDFVIWNVTDSDLIYPGTGEAQLVFTEGEVVAHKAPFKTFVERSIQPSGQIPTPIQNWVEQANEVLEAVEDAIPEGGTTGQVLAKKSNDDFDTEWVDQTGGGGTSDYEELENLPQIGGVTLKGDKSLADLGAASAEAVNAKYTKPASGIPAEDMASGVIPVLTDLIDDTAGSGVTNKVWSADKSNSLLSEINSKENTLVKSYTTVLDTTVTTVSDGDHYSPYAHIQSILIDEKRKYRVTVDGNASELDVGVWEESTNSGAKSYSFVGNLGLKYETPPHIIESDSTKAYCLYSRDDVDPGLRVLTSTAGSHTIKLEQITYSKSQQPSTILYGDNQAPLKREYYNQSSYQSISLGNNAMGARGVIAIGSLNNVENEFGVAIGLSNTVNGDAGIAIGISNEAGQYAFAEGAKNTASGARSHAEGNETTASGLCSHAEGDGVTASGQCSHAEGSGTEATQNYSHAEGYQTKAKKAYSHAEGASTIANGNASHAEGYATEANAVGAHAEGYTTKAGSNFQHVQGQFNVNDANSTYADIVGNGTTDNDRSNAFALDWNGNGRYAGDVYVGCNADSTGGMKVMKEPSSEGTSGQVLTTDGNGGRSWTTPSGGGGNVTDVQINGTSILSQGVANIPYGTSSTVGVVKVNASYGLQKFNDQGLIAINPVNEEECKGGTVGYKPVCPERQHFAVFYGLSKIAGYDLKNVSVTSGTYPVESIDKILQMLGVFDLIAQHETTPSTHAYAQGECFIFNGKLCRATTAISVSDAITIGTNCEQTTLMAEITR